jgi:hypothetical protein
LTEIQQMQLQTMQEMTRSVREAETECINPGDGSAKRAYEIERLSVPELE